MGIAKTFMILLMVFIAGILALVISWLLVPFLFMCGLGLFTAVLLKEISDAKKEEKNEKTTKPGVKIIRWRDTQD